MHVKYILSRLEVWAIFHCLGLGHETMACAVCLLIFLEYLYVGGSLLVVLIYILQLFGTSGVTFEKAFGLEFYL